MEPVEVWASLVAPGCRPDPLGIVARAKRLEADGWSGGTLADSQLLAAEVFTVLALCVAATSKLKLATGTSNPATRHPSVLASAAAALQAASGGRFTLSIGRGDSALSYIGAAPVPLDYFERSLAMLQAYLRGESVPVEEAARYLANLPKDFENLALDSAHTATTMSWLSQAPDYRKPELEVAATGPKVIALGARHAERIAFAMGGNVGRIKGAIAEARAAAERAGRDSASLKFSAFIPLYPHPHLDYARELSKGLVASMARFSVMHNKVVGEVSDIERANMQRIATNYDMKNHGGADSKQSSVLDPEFIDNFGLVGDPKLCAERMIQMAEVGVSKFLCWTTDTEGRPGESYALAAGEVLPKVLAATA